MAAAALSLAEGATRQDNHETGMDMGGHSLTECTGHSGCGGTNANGQLMMCAFRGETARAAGRSFCTDCLLCSGNTPAGVYPMPIRKPGRMLPPFRTCLASAAGSRNHRTDPCLKPCLKTPTTSAIDPGFLRLCKWHVRRMSVRVRSLQSPDKPADNGDPDSHRVHGRATGSAEQAAKYEWAGVASMRRAR